jgi:MarR family transcriptional regulator, organic hydroperoxide resistance regulator
MSLKLEHQLCFALYSSSRQIIKMYQPLLDPLGLTYTQYITMLALWDTDHVPIKVLTSKLQLDTGTLTPLLKKLEVAQLITRNRDLSDERQVFISLTSKGKELQKDAELIPKKLISCVNLPTQEALMLFSLLQKLHQGIQTSSCHVK